MQKVYRSAKEMFKARKLRAVSKSYPKGWKKEARAYFAPLAMRNETRETLYRAMAIVSARWPRLWTLITEIQFQAVYNGLPVYAGLEEYCDNSGMILFLGKYISYHARINAKVSMSQPEAFIPAIEHELVHAAQNWLINRKLNKTFKVQSRRGARHEIVSYSREISRARDFGIGPRRLDKSVSKVLAKTLWQGKVR